MSGCFSRARARAFVVTSAGKCMWTLKGSRDRVKARSRRCQPRTAAGCIAVQLDAVCRAAHGVGNANADALEDTRAGVEHKHAQEPVTLSDHLATSFLHMPAKCATAHRWCPSDIKRRIDTSTRQRSWHAPVTCTARTSRGRWTHQSCASAARAARRRCGADRGCAAEDGWPACANRVAAAGAGRRSPPSALANAPVMRDGECGSRIDTMAWVPRLPIQTEFPRCARMKRCLLQRSWTAVSV